MLPSKFLKSLLFFVITLELLVNVDVVLTTWVIFLFPRLKRYHFFFCGFGLGLFVTWYKTLPLMLLIANIFLALLSSIFRVSCMFGSTNISESCMLMLVIDTLAVLGASSLTKIGCKMRGMSFLNKLCVRNVSDSNFTLELLVFCKLSNIFSKHLQKWLKLFI